MEVLDEGMLVLGKFCCLSEWKCQRLGSSFYRVVTFRNLFISAILDNASFFSWNLNFHCNLIDLEIDLQRLVTSFTHVNLSLFVPVAIAWVLSSSGLFVVKSFFLTLSNMLDWFLSIQSNFYGNLKSHLRSKLLLG